MFILIMKFFKFFDTFGKHLGCHQIPERSFYFRKKQFPLCSRCSGILLGQIIIGILIIFGISFSFLVSFILLLILFLDWFFQRVTKFDSRNFGRFLTGIFGGIGLLNLYYLIIIRLIGLSFLKFSTLQQLFLHLCLGLNDCDIPILQLR